MKLTLIQPCVPSAAAVAEETLRLMETVHDTDLMITTEAVNYPGDVDAAALLPRFAQMAARKHCYVVACLYAQDGTRRFNRAYVLDRGGQTVARYDKVHLVGTEHQTLTPGDRYCVVDADFGRFGVCICWDMQFPEVCRHYALHGARLVVCPTWGWENLYAQSRAYENGIFVAGAMNVPYQEGITGIRSPSEVIAPDGAIIASAAPHASEALTCEVDLSAMRELYDIRMGDRRPDTYDSLLLKSEAIV